MKFFLDTANLDEISRAAGYGLVDGVTTNPSLLAKEGGDWKAQARRICKAVDGPVSLEVLAVDAEGMLKEARELITYGPNVAIKIPMTMDGLAAMRELSGQGVTVNATLIFTPLQALLAAKAGASFVSPFVGRLDDATHDGMEGVADILTIMDNYGFDTEVLVASTRHPMHVLRAAVLGADICTVPFALLEKIAKHPLTDAGLEKFIADFEARFGKAGKAAKKSAKRAAVRKAAPKKAVPKKTAKK